jgi:hypothetical protein
VSVTWQRVYALCDWREAAAETQKEAWSFSYTAIKMQFLTA